MRPEPPVVDPEPVVTPEVPLVPLLPEVSPLVVGLVVAPEVVLVSDAPLLPLLVSDAPEEELPFCGFFVSVVVVVTVPVSLLPEEAPVPGDVALVPDEDAGPDGAAPLCAGSSVVVVVVVVCPNVAVAVPISERKMAMGNFFMLAPSY